LVGQAIEGMARQSQQSNEKPAAGWWDL
jgi:hypothetical protein